MNKGLQNGLASGSKEFHVLQSRVLFASLQQCDMHRYVSLSLLLLYTIASFSPILPTATNETEGVNLTHCLLDFLVFGRQTQRLIKSG